MVQNLYRLKPILLTLLLILVVGYSPAYGIRWPFNPDSVSLPLGNNYGEFQDYGTGPYYHPGIDILQLFGTPVYAVKSGIVKAVLTTSAQYHWRVAIGDSAGSGWCDGWLYAHLDQSTIQVQVGDTVQEGDYLGDLIYWPVAGFHHLHFVKIRNQGTTWSADWLFIGNPLDELVPIDEPDPPVFENVQAGTKFAFCRNNTHDYFNPGTPISGEVDVIAKIYDQVNNTHWKLNPYRVEYSVFNDSVSYGPITSFTFTDTLFWDRNVDVIYQNDATYQTQGDYDYRNFYFIVTNTNGDSIIESSDKNYSWNTADFPNATYWVKVTAFDSFGHVTSDSMQVQVENYFQLTGKVNLSDQPPDASGSIIQIAELARYDTTDYSGSFLFDNVGGGYYSFHMTHTGYSPLDTVAQVTGSSNLQFYLPVEPYVQGDPNHDSVIDIGDVVYLINYLFKNGFPPLPFFSGDANHDNEVNVGDVVSLINYLFRGGPSPMTYLKKAEVKIER